jgi:hypothetical protein
MSSQPGVHGLDLFDKGLLLVAIFSPGNVKSRPGELPDLVRSGLSTGFKDYHKQCFLLKCVFNFRTEVKRFTLCIKGL